MYFLDRDGQTPQVRIANERQKVKKYASIVDAQTDLSNIGAGEIIATEDGDLNLANAWIGTQAQYDALTDIPQDTICFIIDNGDDEYSTDETVTSKTWIDGKPIYRKVLTGIIVQRQAWDSTSSAKFAALNADNIISTTFLTSVLIKVPFNVDLSYDGTAYSLYSFSYTTSNAICIVEYTKQS